MWQDTVMNDEQINEIDIGCGLSEINGSQPFYPLKYEHTLLKAQAEISFKAGIREVVRDLAAIDRDANDVKDFTRRVCDLIVQWQAKLRL